MIAGPVHEAGDFEGGVAQVLERWDEERRPSYVARSGRLIYSALGHEALGEAVALVLGGPAARSDARALREELGQIWSFSLELDRGFPRSLRSEDLGLAGAEVFTVVGFCAEESDAALAQDLLRLDFPGVEVRRVVGGDVRSCPRVKLDEAFAREREPGGTRLPFDPGWPGFSLELVTPEPIEKDGQEYAEHVELRLLRGGQVVTAEELNGMYEPDGEDYLLFQPRLVTLGKRGFVLVPSIGSILDRMGTTRESPEPERKTLAATTLYGYALGKLRPLASFGLRARVEAVGDDWRRLRVTDPDDPVRSKELYRFDAAHAEYQPERAVTAPSGTPPRP